MPSASSHTIFSEYDLQPELNVTRVARGRDGAERAVAIPAIGPGDKARPGRGIWTAGIWNTEVHMIDEIEGFGSELQVHAFRDACVFDDGEIPVDCAWATHIR